MPNCTVISQRGGPGRGFHCQAFVAAPIPIEAVRRGDHNSHFRFLLYSNTNPFQPPLLKHMASDLAVPWQLQVNPHSHQPPTAVLAHIPAHSESINGELGEESDSSDRQTDLGPKALIQLQRSVRGFGRPTGVHPMLPPLVNPIPVSSPRARCSPSPSGSKCNTPVHRHRPFSPFNPLTQFLDPVADPCLRSLASH